MFYTTILHPVRKQLGLTCNEYCVADLIHRLSANPSASVRGWCNASKKYIADEMDLSRQSVITIIQGLIEKGLIEENETHHTRSTSKWYDAIEGCKESLQGVKKLDTHEGEDSVKKVDTPCQESLHLGVKKLDTDNNIENKIDNNKKGEGQKTPTHGNEGKKIDSLIGLEEQEIKKPPQVPARPPASARPKTGNHLFASSPFFDRSKFVEAFQGTDYEIYDLNFYYETVKNWSASKGAMKTDWIATARNFMLGDAKENKARLRPDLQQHTNGNANRNNRQTSSSLAGIAAIVNAAYPD